MLIAMWGPPLDPFDTTPIDAVLFAVGWMIGWALLWRMRPLPAADLLDRGTGRHGERRAIAVVIPARNEAAALPELLTPLLPQLRDGDELVVVDDHSTDATSQVATELGATVLTTTEPPPGWLGKPHACATGAAATTAPVLLFLDADVRPAADVLDRIAVALDHDPDSVVSVQPWHRTGGPAEQASILANVTALMGCGAFSVLGPRAGSVVAFGPVLAVDREVYERAGGHADPTVRTMHTEDIGLARAVGSSSLYTGRPDTSFRMYPGGLADTVRGWSRSIATGARFTRWWWALATLAWVASLAGGWIAAPIVYPLSAVQFYVLGRRAGSVHPLTALCYPIAVLIFVAIFVRSAFLVVTGREIAWKGRRVDARPS